jgi:hypothetical protein
VNTPSIKEKFHQEEKTSQGNHLNERQENSAKEKAESSHENHKRTNIRKGRELEAERNNLAAGGAHGATSRAAEKSAGNVLPRKHAAL